MYTHFLARWEEKTFGGITKGGSIWTLLNIYREEGGVEEIVSLLEPPVLWEEAEPGAPCTDLNADRHL